MVPLKVNCPPWHVGDAGSAPRRQCCTHSIFLPVGLASTPNVAKSRPAPSLPPPVMKSFAGGGGGAVMLNGALVAGVRPGAVASSVEAFPGWTMLRCGKVAAPVTARPAIVPDDL